MSQQRSKLRSFSVDIGTETLNMSEFTLALIEALKDKTVSETLSKSLTSQIKPLCEQISELKQHVIKLEQIIQQKDEKISELESKVDNLSLNVDNLEQYSRRVNIRIDGVNESPKENPTEVVFHLVNKVLKLSPPLEAREIDPCHRIGPVNDRMGNPRKRPLLVKFTSYGSRARVLGLRRRLRNLTKGEPLETGVWPLPTRTDQAETVAISDIEDSVTEDGEEEATATEDECDQINYTAYINKPIYFNEDLTKTRAQLAKAARIAKNNNKINDTWVYDGKILIKEKNGRVAMINRIADLTTYT